MSDNPVNGYPTEATDLVYFLGLTSAGAFVRGTNPVTATKTQTFTNKSLSDSTTFIIDEVDATKKVQFQVSGVATGTTRTWTFPNTSDTFVGTTSSQTLTNKSLDDNTTVFIESGDNTKRMLFELQPITSGQTRVLSVPDATTTLVGTNVAQTLTSKTLTAPVINAATISGTFGGNATFSGTLTITRPAITLQDSTTTFQDDGDNTKQFQLQLSSISTGTTRTWTVPNSSDTFVGAQTSQGLSNKTFEDISTVFADNGDPSKQFIFECSGITTATLRVVTVPDANFTMVGVATTQTLTNKTLTSPTINGATLSGSISGGNINATTLQVGSNDVSMVKISSQTISGNPSSVVFSSIPSSGYTKFVLMCEDISTTQFAQSDGVLIQVSTDNGSTFKTSSGDYYDTTPSAKTALCSFIVAGSTSTYKHGYAEVHLYGLGNSSRATTAKTNENNYWISVTGNTAGTPVDASRVVTEADNAFKLVSANGANLSAGTITLYGIKS